MASWYDFFNELEQKEYYKDLKVFLKKEYSTYTCYPRQQDMFLAFRLTTLQSLKVVIIGQDPYHEEGQAMGLAFSVPYGIKVPPSLVNIYKEIELEYNCKINKDNGDLTYLAHQGVLLLNAYLSVRKGEPLSHKCKGYESFLKDAVEYIDKNTNYVVFMLWGGFAKKIKKYIKNPTHLILEANHPSPLSANRGGWFGCNHFKLANEYLAKNNINQIDWRKY